jgi:late competence protein required for DNA uptake (superfamily II DNA/RNA helicase)
MCDEMSKQPNSEENLNKIKIKAELFIEDVRKQLNSEENTRKQPISFLKKKYTNPCKRCGDYGYKCYVYPPILNFSYYCDSCLELVRKEHPQHIYTRGYITFIEEVVKRSLEKGIK